MQNTAHQAPFCCLLPSVHQHEPPAQQTIATGDPLAAAVIEQEELFPTITSHVAVGWTAGDKANCSSMKK